MIAIKFQNVRLWNDDTKFYVTTEKGMLFESDNAAMAREFFLNEVDRAYRKAVNEKLAAEGYNIHTGERIAVDCNSGA